MNFRIKEKLMLWISGKKTKYDKMIFFLAWTIMFTDNEKVLVLKLLGMKNVVFFEPKS